MTHSPRSSQAPSKPLPTALTSELERIYYDESDPGSLGGQRALYSSANQQRVPGLTHARVAQFLKEHETYTLHKPLRHKFLRIPIIVRRVDEQWQADLADVSDIASENDGFRYLLTVVDCLSKYAWVVPTKTKDAHAMVEAFRRLFRSSRPRIPEKLQTDKGKEFFNSEVASELASHKVKHFATHNVETKAAMVERFNRTLKTRMYHLFTANDNKRWVETLQTLVDAYNRSRHRTTGMRPIDVEKKHEKYLFHRIYGKFLGTLQPRTLPHLSKDQPVRITKSKGVFDKGYLPSWTHELFKVVSARTAPGKRLYKVRDYADEILEGHFYPEELQSITDTGVYTIEKVLAKRTHKGVKEVHIKWKGWPTKFNTWIPETDINKYGGASSS